MYFESFADFWAMDGYAVYVWSSVLITLVSLFLLALSSLWTKRSIFKRIAGELERAEKIKQAKLKAKAQSKADSESNL